MEEKKYVAVNINACFVNVYDFAETYEDAELVAFDAKCKAMEDAKKFRCYAEKYGADNPKDKEYWLRRAEEEDSACYKAMTFDEFLCFQRKYYIGRPVVESTEEEFYKQLEVLPPIKWTTINGVEMFCMSEFLTGSYTSQYARVGDKYYAAIVDAYDRSTWIHNRLPQ